MRSRASGGSWGDSVAASSAATRSSLRRRAICRQRARSIERSSTGGRTSARATALASPGSASRRSHASTSRTSLRSKNAPASSTRCGTPRSSSATAIAWPSSRTDRTSTAIDPRGSSPDPAPAPSSLASHARSTSAATAWAWARSPSQRQNATPSPVAGPAARRAGGDRPGRAPATRAEVDPLGVAQSGRGRRQRGVRRRRDELDTVALEQSDEQRRDRRRGVEVVDEHLGELAPDARPHVGPRTQQRDRVRHDVRRVTQACSREHPIVRREQRRELSGADRARLRGGGRRRSEGARGRVVRPVVLRDVRQRACGLERVDPRDERRERARRVAAQVVLAQRQVVDAPQQCREPVGAARRRQLVAALLREQAARERQRRGHVQLVVGLRDRGLQPLAHDRRARRGDAEDQHALGAQAAVGELRGATDERARATGAALAADEQ